ncbi:MAG: efflux RND transporter periplasmic adaptor subunit [Terriglobia bacterium]
MKRYRWLILVPVAVFGFWVFQKKTEPPRVVFSRPRRQTISNTLSTNGKVEPIEYVDVRAEASGLLSRMLVHQGETVRAGQALAELSQPGLAQDLQAAEARRAQAEAELSTLRGGGRGSDVAEIEGNVTRLRAQRDAAQRNLEALERLQAANAATRFEVDQARQAVADMDVQMQSLGKRRSALVGGGDLASAQARVREAEANVALAKMHLGQNVIHTPIGGIVYSLPARQGVFLNPGDLVGSVGRLDPVRVRVYVDEPDLGRVAVGEAVRITWDALAGKEWLGTVERRPIEVVSLGSRQVGEVLCTIANPNRLLTPGANVNAFVLTHVVDNALTLPKTSVHRDNGIGVYVLEGDRLKWRNVKTGVSDALRVEVVSGLQDGDAVAEPSEQALRDGARVTAVIR